MKQRNPLAVFALSIVTLGIYDIYWLVVTKNELNQKTRQHVPSIWLLIAPSLVLIFGYILLIVSAVVSRNNVAYGSNSGEGLTIFASIFLILGWIAVLFIGLYWFFKFSKAINEYTSGKMSTAVTFLILYLIHLIGVALIQDTFNDMIDGTTVGAPQPVGYTPPVSRRTDSTSATDSAANYSSSATTTRTACTSRSNNTYSATRATNSGYLVVNKLNVSANLLN
ncbi:MAG: DUF4234 domain-containing protein [Candidatus Saccharibacteria bacterium]